jgi:hypothetical protein
VLKLLKYIKYVELFENLKGMFRFIDNGVVDSEYVATAYLKKDGKEFEIKTHTTRIR